MFGTLGYLVANLIIEKTITDRSAKQVKGKSGKVKKKYNFENLKYYQAITTFIAIGLSFFLISPGTAPQRRGELMRSWKELLSNKAYMFFILIILANGVTRAAMTLYLTLYLTDIIKLQGYNIPSSWPWFLTFPIQIFNDNPLATTAFFGVILEIVILYNSQKITNRFGLYWPLFFAQVFQLLRFFCYYTLNVDAFHAFLMVCLFELMKGLNFGLTHISAVQIATMLCPVHLKTTSQMIYSGTFTGLASVVAGVVFGRVFKEEEMGATETDVGEKIRTFKLFYLNNLIINTLSVLFFACKYGMIDETLNLDVLLGRRSGEDEIDQSGRIKKRAEKENIEKEVNNGKNESNSDNNSESKYNEIGDRKKEVKAEE